MDQKHYDQYVYKYMKRYAKEWESPQECSERIVNEWIVANPKEEQARFIDIMKEIFPKRSVKLAESTWRRLYFDNWPKCLNEDWTLRTD